MTFKQLAASIQAVLRNHCTTAEVGIISHSETNRNHGEPCFYIGVSAANAVELDKIQAILVGTDAEFVDWVRYETGDLMVYRVSMQAESKKR